jgi:membrane associated rhomboid family serine protease
MSKRRRITSDHWAKGQMPLVVLMGVMVGIFFCQEWLPYFLFERWMAVPADVGAGWQGWREGGGVGELGVMVTLLTAAFLHGGLDHLLFNLVLFWIFASQLVDLLGHRWMLGVFVFTAVTGSLCHVWLNPGDVTPMLGASGAVMGFEGAYLALSMRWQLPVAHVWPMSRPMEASQFAAVGIIGLIMDFIGMTDHHACSQVAYGAHVGGFAGGMILIGLFAPRPGGAVAR